VNEEYSGFSYVVKQEKVVYRVVYVVLEELRVKSQEVE
jgi:hypothetical protein